MKANDLINMVFKKLGNPLPADIQTILGGSLSAIDVDDAVASKFNVDYFTKEAALQNPDIKNTLRAEVLNGIDAELDKVSDKFEFDDATKEVLKKEKTSKRIEVITDKIRELSEKKAGTNKVDKDAYNKELEKYNAEILALRTTHASELEAEKSGRKTDRVNWELDGIYSGLDYSSHKDKKTAIIMAKAVMAEKIKAEGLKFDITENGAKILTKENTDLYVDNKPVSPSDYIKKTLIENDLIKVSDGKTPPANGGNTGNNNNQGSNNNNNGGGNGKLSEYQIELNRRKVEAGIA